MTNITKVSKLQHGDIVSVKLDLQALATFCGIGKVGIGGDAGHLADIIGWMPELSTVAFPTPRKAVYGRDDMVTLRTHMARTTVLRYKVEHLSVRGSKNGPYRWNAHCSLQAQPRWAILEKPTDAESAQRLDREAELKQFLLENCGSTSDYRHLLNPIMRYGKAFWHKEILSVPIPKQLRLVAQPCACDHGLLEDWVDYIAPGARGLIRVDVARIGRDTHAESHVQGPLPICPVCEGGGSTLRASIPKEYCINDELVSKSIPIVDGFVGLMCEFGVEKLGLTLQ